MTRACGRRRSRHRGSLLVITLWLVALLSMLAVAIARYLSLDVRLARYQQAREQARALARGAVYVAMGRLAQDQQDAGEPYDWLGDDWARPMDPIKTAAGEARIVAIEDENRRLDLNTLTLETLARLIGPGALAQRIIDYIDGPDPAEEEPPYIPKNGPLASLDELWEIPGMTNEAVDTLKRTTVIVPAGEQGHTVNINTVEPDVLLAIGGDTIEGQPTAAVVQALVQARPGNDGEFGTEDDHVIQDLSTAPSTLEGWTRISQTLFTELLSKGTFGIASTIFRIHVEGRVATPAVTYRIEAVVQRSGGSAESKNPIILSWREG